MDPDQTARMCRLVWIHAGRKPIMLVLLCRGSNNNVEKSVDKCYFDKVYLHEKSIVFVFILTLLSCDMSVYLDPMWSS
jgi:hypothetical protein